LFIIFCSASPIQADGSLTKDGIRIKELLGKGLLGDAKYDCASFIETEKVMFDVLDKIRVEYADEAEFLQKLEESQVAWENYRSAHIKALFPKEDTRRHYGSVYPICLCLNLKNRTEIRTEELRLWLNKLEEGDVCSGSVRFK
jgi:hypothetical protein